MTRIGGPHKRPKICVTRKLGVSLYLKNIKVILLIYPNQAKTFARFKGKCAVCKEPIKKKDPIRGVFIDGKGHEWDCKTMCGKAPKYVKTEEGFRVRLPCRHFNEIFWVHRSCSY